MKIFTEILHEIQTKDKLESELKLPEDKVKVRSAYSRVVSIEEHSLSISTEISAQPFSFYSNKHFVIHVGNYLPRLGWEWGEGREASDLCH